MTVKCPTCKKAAKLGSPEFPFCSERCRDIDLGTWAEEKYRIPDASPPSELDLAGSRPNELLDSDEER
jgi:hypothetical protein